MGLKTGLRFHDRKKSGCNSPIRSRKHLGCAGCCGYPSKRQPFAWANPLFKTPPRSGRRRGGSNDLPRFATRARALIHRPNPCGCSLSPWKRPTLLASSPHAHGVGRCRRNPRRSDRDSQSAVLYSRLGAMDRGTLDTAAAGPCRCRTRTIGQFLGEYPGYRRRRCQRRLQMRGETDDRPSTSKPLPTP